MMRALLAMLKASSDFSCAGASRGLKTGSESSIRVVATIMPSVEVCWNRSSRSLKIEFQYVLFDEMGDLHPPKDENRREIAMDAQLVLEMRQQVLTDLLEMGSLGCPLSAGFWRQLQREEKALEVEALAHNRTQAKGAAVAVGSKRSRCANVFEVAEITAQQGKQYLVRWAGYHPSWEAWRLTGVVGGPVETWETEGTVARTEAMVVWRAGARQD